MPRPKNYITLRQEFGEKASAGYTSRKNASFALPMIFIEGGGTDMAGFEKLLVVRGLRLLRLARVLRMVGRFKAGRSKPAITSMGKMLGRGVDRYDGCSLAVSIIFYIGFPSYCVSWHAVSLLPSQL